jgi:TubC N-terminal docking domain
MSALPLIEAVERAGGAIALRGDRLRLSAPEPLPENLLEELRAHKAEVLDHLRLACGAMRKGTKTVTPTNVGALPKEPVAAWSDGVAILRSMPPPRTYPAHAWKQLILDAQRFLEDWAPQAAALGWPGWELFGCHKRAPWGRIQGMGLVLLLRGDELAALTATEAAIHPDGRAPDLPPEALRPAPSRRALPGLGAGQCALSSPRSRRAG